jgi:hypothetical protein
VFKDGLHSPKTTAGEDCRFRGFCGGERSIERGLGDGSGRRGGRTGAERAESVPAKEENNDGESDVTADGRLSTFENSSLAIDSAGGKGNSALNAKKGDQKRAAGGTISCVYWNLGWV